MSRCKFELRLDPQQKRLWETFAARNGLTLSAFVRRCVAEAIALERATGEPAGAETEEQLSLA